MINFDGIDTPVWVEYGSITAGVPKGKVAFRFPNGLTPPRVCTADKFKALQAQAEDVSKHVKWAK